MRPQASLNSIPNRRFRRGPARCQRVWQTILILATLALAIAANAQQICSEAFSSQTTPLHRGDATEVSFNFAKLTNVDPVKQELFEIAMDDVSRSIADQKAAHDAVVRAQTKRGRNAEAEIAIAQLRLKKIREHLEDARLIALFARQGGLVPPKIKVVLARHKFIETFTLKSRADASKFASRLNQLVAMGASVDTRELPATGFQRVFNTIVNGKRTKLYFALVAMSLAGTIYHVYMDRHPVQSETLRYQADPISQTQAADAKYLTEVYDDAPGAPARTADGPAIK